MTTEAAALPRAARGVARGALPGYFLDHPQWDALVGAVVRQTGVPVVAGALDAEFLADGRYDYYNAAFLFDTSGTRRAQPSYRKTYLVPITERVAVPAAPLVRGTCGWFGGFSHGDRFRSTASRKAASGSSSATSRRTRTGAATARGRRLLLNITNDAWFGPTSRSTSTPRTRDAPIETRMGVARAANTGISQCVDPLGGVHPPPARCGARGRRPRLTPTSAPYVRLGTGCRAGARGTAALLLAAFGPSASPRSLPMKRLVSPCDPRPQRQAASRSTPSPAAELRPRRPGRRARLLGYDLGGAFTAAPLLGGTWSAWPHGPPDPRGHHRAVVRGARCSSSSSRARRTTRGWRRSRRSGARLADPAGGSAGDLAAITARMP